MPSAFRVCPTMHARDGAAAFSGEGARLHDGRWNSKGVAVAYASSTLSLSALELLVHAEQRLLSALVLVACEAVWPDGLATETLDPVSLSPSWRDTPPPTPLQAFGDRWVRERRTAVLYVPSAIIPSERNIVINPAHRDARRIRTSTPEPFSYDARLLRS
jgi:RES domain-containing protein